MTRLQSSSSSRLLVTLRDVEEGAVNLRRVGEALAVLKGQLTQSYECVFTLCRRVCVFGLRSNSFRVNLVQSLTEQMRTFNFTHLLPKHIFQIIRRQHGSFMTGSLAVGPERKTSDVEMLQLLYLSIIALW